MVVRVKVKIINEKKGRSKELVVLVNSGAESEEPVVVVNSEIAKELGIEDFDIIEVELASGRTYNLLSRDKFKIELLDEFNNVLSTTYAYVAVDEYLNEPLITDATIEELGIQILSAKRGYWRHINDPPNKIRKSVS